MDKSGLEIEFIEQRTTEKPPNSSLETYKAFLIYFFYPGFNASDSMIRINHYFFFFSATEIVFIHFPVNDPLQLLV